MRKQDIIRIINEEIEFALEEQEKQLYKVVDDKGKTIKPDESSDIDGLIKKIATKLAAKNPKWSIEKINEMYDPIYDTMLPEILVMISAGVIGVKKAIKYLKEKGLEKQEIIDVIKKAKSKLDESLEATNKKTGKDVTKHVNDYMAGNIDKKEFEKLTGLKKESINENEGMTKSLKDIDPSLSLTKYDTTPPSFKVTYIRKDDMSKEMEEELVAWVLSKGGRVDSVETMFDVEDGERYYYPYVKFSYK